MGGINIPLQIKVPDIANPLETYGKVLSLRDMVEQAKYRQQQMQHIQMQIEQERRDMADEQAFRAALPTLGENASLADLARYGKRGVDFYRQTREAKTAALAQQEKENVLQKARDEELTNAMSSVMAEPDPAKRAALYQRYNEGFVKRGLITPEEAQSPIPDDNTFKQFYIRKRGPGAWEDLQAKKQAAIDKAADQARAAAEEVRKTEEEKRKEAKAPFELQETQAKATTAQQVATGTQPITPHQTAEAESKLWSEPGGLISIIGDPNRSTEDKTRALAGLRRHEELRRAGATTMMITPNQNIANEAKLRDDYYRDSKNYITIRDAYNKIVGAAKSGTAAGDIGLIYGFMKLQDPGSTVREGEFANAQNAGGIPERIRAMYNKAIDGERLAPAVRDDFVVQSRKIHDQSYADYQKTKDMYTGIATRGGMNPQNVVIDYSTATPPNAPKVKVWNEKTRRFD